MAQKEQTKKYTDKELGEITMRKIRASKHMGIKVRPLRGVLVTLPYYCSYKDAEKFLRSKIDWIKNAISAAQEIENTRTLFQPGTDFATREHQLEFIATNVDQISTRLSKNKIKIYYPNTLTNWSQESIQTIIRNAIEKALRKEAAIMLPLLTKNYANTHNLTLRNITLRASRGRWGSCNSRNDIHLNIHLMRLPESLMRYVLLHELAHTRHHNHNKDFWALLNVLCLQELEQSATILDKGLKIYHPHLY